LQCAAWELEYYPNVATPLAFEELHKPVVGKFGLLLQEPVEVVGAIIVRDGPVIAFRQKLAITLPRGGIVTFKSSPESPGKAFEYAKTAEDVALPCGVFNSFPSSRKVSELLVGKSADGHSIADAFPSIDFVS
jgi:acyl-CoA reductase-like NAD-dependent aldehyde dehydrogenase